MKKLIFTFAALLAVMATACSGDAKNKKNINESKIIVLVDELRADAALYGEKSERESVTLPGIKVVSDNNLEFVSIGGIGIKLIKWGAKVSDDDDAKLAMAAFDGVKRLMVLDYENCDKALKERFNKKIGRTLEGCELMMEAKDEEETMSIYGTLSGDGSKISDIVMYAPESSALICFFGTIDTDELGKLVETANKTE